MVSNSTFFSALKAIAYEINRLIGKGKVAEARAIVARFHANGDSDHPLVQLEMSEMANSLSEEGMVGWRNFFDLRVLVKTKARRYRLMLNMSFAWFSQFSGNK